MLREVKKIDEARIFNLGDQTSEHLLVSIELK